LHGFNNASDCLSTLRLIGCERPQALVTEDELLAQWLPDEFDQHHKIAYTEAMEIARASPIVVAKLRKDLVFGTYLTLRTISLDTGMISLTPVDGLPAYLATAR
jgi:hypothetical protein